MPMGQEHELVVTLDGRVSAPGLPVVCADDPLFVRGDGVFETLLLRDGRPSLLEAHLARLGTSAAIVGLAPPELATWRTAVTTAVARWGAADEGVLRMVYGRRRDGASVGFVTVSRVPARVAAARSDGVAAVTLDRGLPGAGSAAPWSLAGAKSVSYAVNVAALRHAAALGADEAVFLSSDGFVLEGPRSTVVIYVDGALVTPPTSLPILSGITAQALFDAARERGLACEQALLRKTDLLAAQGVWLLSSVTLAARVHTLDDESLRAPPMAAELAALVDAAIACEP
ncbi:MAG: 4-amino-4-deoxychorismate lyase [Mycobacterium sp.]|nr:4-amino-4-deoxychorismate lyase [Mycobacterium sp.]